MKESYENMRLLLEKIHYEEHKWQICADGRVKEICQKLNMHGKHEYELEMKKH